MEGLLVRQVGIEPYLTVIKSHVPQPLGYWRRLVEVRGVEPRSKTKNLRLSTNIANIYFSFNYSSIGKLIIKEF